MQTFKNRTKQWFNNNIIETLHNKNFQHFFWAILVFMVISLIYYILGWSLIPIEKNINKFTSVSSRHIAIIEGMIPALSILSIFWFEIVWLINSDENGIILKKWFYLFFAIISLGIISLLIPWKWFSPVLTITTVILIPIFVKNSEAKSESTHTTTMIPGNSSSLNVQNIVYGYKVKHSPDIIITTNDSGWIMVTTENSTFNGNAIYHVLKINPNTLVIKHDSPYNVLIKGRIITITK